MWSAQSTPSPELWPQPEPSTCGVCAQALDEENRAVITCVLCGQSVHDCPDCSLLELGGDDPRCHPCEATQEGVLVEKPSVSTRTLANSN